MENSLTLTCRKKEAKAIFPLPLRQGQYTQKRTLTTIGSKQSVGRKGTLVA